MKKMTLALALVLLLSCFLLAACSGDGDNNTSGTSSVTATSKTESSKTESSKTESSKTESSKAASSEAASAATSAATSSAATSAEESNGTTSGTTSAVSGVSEELKREGTNLALNCTVAGAEVPSREDIQTYSASLTDGKAGDVAYDNSWFGYWWNSEAQYVEQSNTKNGVGTATVDLGSVKDIKEVCVHLTLGNDAGIISPASVKFEYSEDGTNYTLIGEKTYEKPTDKVTLTANWVGFSMPETVKAQYVRISIQVNGIWTFLNEIEVY